MLSKTLMLKEQTKDQIQIKKQLLKSSGLRETRQYPYILIGWTQTSFWKTKPLDISPSEPLPAKGIAAVSHSTLNQQVFSVPRLTLLRKEQASTHRKVKTVYIHCKKPTLNSNLKAVVSRYCARKADWKRTLTNFI